MNEIIPSLLYSLPRNILQKISYAQQDFLGFTVNINIFSTFFVSLIFALFITFLSYSIGKKILSIFNDTTRTRYQYLVSIAIGYIAISSGIAILGLFSLFNFTYITLYLFFVFLYSFLFPFSLKNNLITVFVSIKNDFTYLKKSKFIFVWTGLFVLIALLNLINPEIREDQYHTDLPIIYLKNQTIMIPPYEKFSVSASPLLSEMYYTPGILYISKESARYTHFIYYILVLLTLINFSRLKKYKFAIYTPLLFASAPVVIHETSSMYVDFQWILCFLLSTLMLLDQKNNRFSLIKSGVLFGGVLATKLWTIVFSIVFAAFILTSKEDVNKKIIHVLLFILFTLLVSVFWFFRAYVLTGNPLFPAFGNAENSSNFPLLTSLSYFVGINYQLLNIFSFINVFSPLFFLSFFFLISKIGMNTRLILELELFRYLFFLFVLYLLIHYPFGRYLLGLYVIFIFLNSLAINTVYNRFRSVKILLNCILMLLFFYYLFNSLLVLPYAVGIENKNNYLTRILSRDNSSYYDFNHKFDKFLFSKDLVATYEIYGFYYANFDYVYADYIFSKTKDFSALKNAGATKLFIKGGDIIWLCGKNKLVRCDAEKYQLLSEYSAVPNSAVSYYLYEIK